MRVLVTGISGHLGRSLTSVLGAGGHDVVGFSRHPEAVDVAVPVLAGDAAEGSGLQDALEGIEVAYYLIHSYESSNPEGFVVRDRRAAGNFAAAAAMAGVKRVVYLGVPAPTTPNGATTHITSRHEVGRILAREVPCMVELRTWHVVSGMTHGFRVIFNVIDKQPVVLLPPWRNGLTQPIDARDVVAGLAAAATAPALDGQVLDLMGPETVTVGEMITRIAAALGRKCRFVGVPFDFPQAMTKLMARMSGEDPALILPLSEGQARGDFLARTDAAGILGINRRPLEEACRHAAAEWRDTAAPVQPPRVRA